MAASMDLTGQRFGRLVALNKLAVRSGHGSVWLCRCDCGKETSVRRDQLMGGNTKSCGCLRNDVNTIHGESKTKLHRIWAGMKQRCYDPNTTGYQNYGGRGVRVCDEWKNDFCAFRDWALISGYREGLSIERQDTSGNYTPENCRWATAKEQANNRRSNILITYQGITLTEKQWAEKLGISYNTLHTRIKTRGWDIDRAFTTPVQSKRRFLCQT